MILAQGNDKFFILWHTFSRKFFEKMSETLVRFPPSPTGLLHIGTVRTCLFNYLFAKKNNGKIIFRFEDTDKTRSEKRFEENILSGLQNLGLTWDGEPIYQSERTAIYRAHLEKLLASGAAYYCFCTAEELEQERAEQTAKKLPPRYSGKCGNISVEEAEKRIEKGEKAVIRFRVPENREIIFDDLVRGKITINTREISDFVIAKDLDTPLYNFCVVVDDTEMRISHVIRGEDHISNTPKQILIFEALGFPIPQFAHLPLILNSDKSKLSKRKNQVSVDDFLAEGILPGALLNYLALLGWNPGDTREIFSLDELISEFSLERVQKSGAIFDRDRLLFVNQKYISELSEEDFLTECAKFLPKFSDEKLWKKVCLLSRSRLKLFSELPEVTRFFAVSDADFSPPLELFENPKMKVTAEIALHNLEKLAEFWNAIPEEEWNHDTLKDTTIPWIAEIGEKNGAVLWPARVSMSGEKFSPSPFEIADAFGKERSLRRIKKGIEVLR